MKIKHIPYKNTGYFSSLMCDYLDQKKELNPFYHRFPNLENFKEQIAEKGANFTQEQRNVLVASLHNQYSKTTSSNQTKANISLLKDATTFTVVTGHQLNLFTGPLYFLYKIISTINLTNQLKKEYPKFNFVPVYWMATEDHDFEEINYFNFKGKKIQWNSNATGGVGRFDTEGLQAVFEAFSSDIGGGTIANELKSLFEDAYLKHANLTDATRFLANSLFTAYGLVIIDGDDVALKKMQVPYVKDDLFHNTAFKKVGETIENLSAVSSEYKIQVNPREINYFYLIDGIRERIVAKDNYFHVLNTTISFSKVEILKELDEFPERFSPNVVTRPLFQEVILPNLCYIGGGGELAYWLELKSYFESQKVAFPMLLLRNSALIIAEKQAHKLEKLNISIQDLFLKQNSLVNKKIREISNIDIDFSEQKEHLVEQFKSLYVLAEQTDKSFLGAVKAQEVKQIKGLEALESRLLQAQKRKLKDQVVRMTEIQNELFPNKSLQERNQNFSEHYLEFGSNLIPQLIKHLKPLDDNFLILEL
ncbi:bacillithiol biosynthesis cysteine-adding enzyme BshC [Cellulophaga sp. F20128]|uniref:bacillithiol biosynthesis cysteine-adding enzyme BshC n=1 Tax=Cellulophaga sp. F20128 TaxID=2926413 RepID=UPI001FF4ED36|nr:bacillithiol biosynthesis cysteine-adding enzyme BshC [Cellulophaga sp. F20128]MCK0157568.1 bacillithiol biosynthesis cysteine-adding enzyme BshC [Cellulophaga sp. F20128]